MSRTIADSLGRYYLLSRTIRDEYVFHFFISNRLSDGYPGRGVLNTPPARLSSPPTPFAGRLVWRMQYAPTLPAEKSDLKGWRGVMFGTMGDESVFHSIMSNQLSNRYLGRAQKHTLHIDSTSTISPFAGRLVGRMQYAPTLSKKDKVYSGRCFPLSRTMADKSVFHFSISNRLSDRRLGRAQKHTPLAHLSSTPTPFAGHLVGRMQYAPTLSKKDKVSLGMCFLLSWTIRDKSVFLFSMFNRLSDRYPCRGVLNTPHIDSTSIHSPFAGRLVGRMQYAPTLPAEKSDLKGWRGIMFGSRGDEYVFHSSMSNRLSDRYSCRGVLNTPLAHLSSTISPFAGRLVGRMQYAPTLSEKDEVSLGRYYLLSRTIRDEYVFNSIMSNRLSDRYPGRGVLHTPLIDSTSTHSPFAGRLVGRMQYAPTLPEKERFPRVGITYCLRQSETNTYFISPCLIGYQMGTRVGAYCIRPLRVYRLPFRPLRGVW